MLLMGVCGTGSSLSGSMLWIPKRESTRFTVKFSRLTTMLVEDVTRKVWLILPSSEPCTWHHRREQRFRTDDKRQNHSNYLRLVLSYHRANNREIRCGASPSHWPSG